MFGVYPPSSDVTYIQEAYTGVYKPDKVSANPDTWRWVFVKGAETPLRVTQHGLDTQRYWYHDLLLFVFDAEIPAPSCGWQSARRDAQRDH